MNARFASLLFLGIGAAAPSIVFPGILGALVTSGLASPSLAASVVSIELAGMMVSALLVSWLGARIAFHRVATISVIAFIALDLATAAFPSAALLLPLRGLAGMGEGAAIAAMAAMATSLPSAERYFAVSVACNLAASALLLRVFPFAVTGGIGTVFGLLALVAAPSLVLLRRLPRNDVRAADGVAPGPVLSRGIVFASLGTLLFFAAMSAAWSIVAQAAASVGLSFDDASQVLALATGAGIATGFVVSWVSSRVTRRFALLGGTAAMAVAMLCFATSLGRDSFAPAALLLMIAYVFALPFYFGTIAALDPTGRVMAFAIALQFAGLAIGPAAASVILKDGVERVFPVACLACIAAGLLAFFANPAPQKP